MTEDERNIVRVLKHLPVWGPTFNEMFVQFFRRHRGWEDGSLDILQGFVDAGVATLRGRFGTREGLSILMEAVGACEALQSVDAHVLAFYPKADGDPEDDAKTQLLVDVARTHAAKCESCRQLYQEKADIVRDMKVRQALLPTLPSQKS